MDCTSFAKKIFFCKHFNYKTGFCNKKFNFCEFAIFLQILTQEFSNDVSFVIFGHQTWDLEGAYPGFQVPSRDRVKIKKNLKW